MKKPILYAITILFVLGACTENEESARIILKLNSFDDEYFLLSLTPIGGEQSFNFDTLPVYNGKASLDRNIYEPHKGYIIGNGMFKYLDDGSPFLIRSKVIEFFIDQNQTVTISGKIKEYSSEYTIAGSDLNKQFTDFNKSRSHIYEKLSKTMFLYENCFFEEVYDDDQIFLLEQKQAELYPQILQNEIDYILSNPDNELSAYLLSKQSIDTLLKYYETLSATALETNYGRLLERKADRFNILTPGDLAPLFEHKTLQEEEFRLKDYIGSTVVLYFWGTWCAPCRGEIPDMKEFYQEYNEKLKLVGIACRDNRESVTKFIHKNDIRWIQLLNTENSDPALSKLYGVKGFPTKIVIDQHGFVRGIFTGVTEEFYTKVDKLVNE